MAKTKQQIRKKYGWQPAKPTQSTKNSQFTNKKQEREQKKKQRLLEQKLQLIQQKSHTNHIKIIGIIPMQNNLQPLEFIEGYMLYHKSIRLQLPDGQPVFQTPGRKQLVLFQEINSIDQCFTVDAFLQLGIAGKEENYSQNMIQEIRALKLDSKETLKLQFNESVYLAFLLQFNNYKATGNFAEPTGYSGGHQSAGQVPTDQEHFRTTENFLFRLQFNQVPWLQDRFYMNVLGFEWLEVQNSSPAMKIYGCAHGKFNFGAQCLYLTNFGDQLKAEEMCFYDLQINQEAAQIIPILKSQNKVFQTPENQQYKEKLSMQAEYLIPAQNEGNQMFKNVYSAQITAPEGFQDEEDDENPENAFHDDETDTNLQDTETTESTSIFDGAPIQLDYEEKRQQFKTAEEQMDFPDEIDINPESSLRTILRGYHTMKSLRNSVFPTDELSPVLPGELQGLYDVRQPVQLQQAFVKGQIDQIEFTGEMISIIITLDYNMAPFYEKMIGATQQLLGPAWERFNADKFAQQITPKLFDNITPLNQSLIGLFQHETRYSVCHLKVLRQYQRHLSQEQLEGFTYQCNTPWEIQFGFRRLYTIPTPYISLGDFRGKLLRFYDGKSDFAMSFVAPIFLTRDAFPPVILRSDVTRFNRKNVITPEASNFDGYSTQYNLSMIPYAQNLTLHAHISKFTLRFQILERVTLNGVPMRISRTKSVIKSMFFNKDDVLYFNRERIETENGVQGRILRPVTEKGYFKARFDSIPNSNDVILMKLHRPLPNTGAAAGLMCELCPGVCATAPAAFDELFTFMQRAHERLLTELRDRTIQ